jgi:putative hemolysin
MFPELSYASTDDPAWKRALIGLVEWLSGRDRLLPLYRRWRSEILPRSSRPMTDLIALINVTLDVDGAWPVTVDKTSPLVMIANHPFGIGDGMAMLALAEALGRPFRVLINNDLMKVPEVRPYALPIDFSGSEAAKTFNVKTRIEARRLLGEGVTIVVFPAGGVATARIPFGRAEELPWGTFTAGLVQQARAGVLPVYFEGQNSWLFHLASRLGQTPRLSLLVSEFRRFVGSRVVAHVGPIVPFSALAAKSDRKALTRELHGLVLGLDVRPRG